jgi:hypothetical protein
MAALLINDLRELFIVILICFMHSGMKKSCKLQANTKLKAEGRRLNAKTVPNGILR